MPPRFMQEIIWDSTLDQFFDSTTMSVHFKANRPITSKKGEPGKRKASTSKESYAKEKLEGLIQGIFSEVEEREDWFLEIDRSLSKVVQLGPYRIVIVYPPLSDGLEMTVVKPVKRLTITDYKLDAEVLELFKNKAKGILVSGSPWSGKTTFAQALVDLYEQENHVLKTIESPRDLMVSDDVVQYSFTHGSHEEIRDILLLSRPDYTVYDEVRNKNDFDLYKDLRLTGIGLIWVIHATRPVDGIQRFLGNIEMGIIPQVLDTVVYIDKWQVSEILHLELVVKVPEGMFSDDLARPVIQITSFFTKKLQYEIYTFGEQIVVMPIGEDLESKAKGSSINQYAKRAIQQQLTQILPFDFLVWMTGSNGVTLYIPSEYKARVIGKAGSAIMDLEKTMWLSIQVKTFDDVPILSAKTEVEQHKQFTLIRLPIEYAGEKITLLVDDQVFHSKADHEAIITLKKTNLIKNMNKKWFLVVDTHKL